MKTYQTSKDDLERSLKCSTDPRWRNQWYSGQGLEPLYSPDPLPRLVCWAGAGVVSIILWCGIVSLALMAWASV